MSSGPAYTRLFGSAQELSFESEAVFDNTYAVQRKEEMRGKIYGSVHFLELYNTNTPFEQEAWELIALDEADNLHSFSKKVTTDILLVLTVSILLGGGVYFDCGLPSDPPDCGIIPAGAEE